MLGYALSLSELQILQTNRRNSKQTRKLLYYHAKLGYYHGNCRLLRDSIKHRPIAPLSAALKSTKNGVHQPPWWTPPSLKSLDFKPFFHTFACEHPNVVGHCNLFYIRHLKGTFVYPLYQVKVCPYSMVILCSTFLKILCLCGGKDSP